LLALCFTRTPPTQVYTLSLHDALPIFTGAQLEPPPPDDGHLTCATVYAQRIPQPSPRIGPPNKPQPAPMAGQVGGGKHGSSGQSDRKSTRLNSSHVKISYAVFCLKKKK